jgi:hypothetical protein
MHFFPRWLTHLLSVKLGTRCSGLPPFIPLIPKRRKSISTHQSDASGAGLRLNKFVRRLHDMLKAEKDSGIVEWRRGLLVLYSTDAFAKQILPKYFNTRNFKTFRRQVSFFFCGSTSAPSLAHKVNPWFGTPVKLLRFCTREVFQHYWCVHYRALGQP